MSGQYIIPVLTDENLVKMYKHIGDYPVRTSVIRKLASKLTVPDLAIKFVLEGKERYIMEQSEHLLGSGHYVLANKFSGCYVDIDQQEQSKGICIDISYDYVEQILTGMYHPNELERQLELRNFYFTPQLFEHGRKASDSMQQLMHTVWNKCQRKEEMHWMSDFLKDIACQTVLDQQLLCREYNRLHVMKPATRKELFRRLQQSLIFINDNLMVPMGVADIAHSVNLSEFRYYHVFKQVFGTSPHKYIQSLRLQRAADLKQHTRCSWSEIAEMTGFPDLPSFSKAFKKQFGVSPADTGW